MLIVLEQQKHLGMRKTQISLILSLTYHKSNLFLHNQALFPSSSECSFLKIVSSHVPFHGSETSDELAQNPMVAEENFAILTCVSAEI